jgi:hypothetical protein
MESKYRSRNRPHQKCSTRGPQQSHSVKIGINEKSYVKLSFQYSNKVSPAALISTFFPFLLTLKGFSMYSTYFLLENIACGAEIFPLEKVLEIITASEISWQFLPFDHHDSYSWHHDSYFFSWDSQFYDAWMMGHSVYDHKYCTAIYFDLCRRQSFEWWDKTILSSS